MTVFNVIQMNTFSFPCRLCRDILILQAGFFSSFSLLPTWSKFSRSSWAFKYLRRLSVIVRCDTLWWIDLESKAVPLHIVWQFAPHGPDHQGIPDGSSAFKLREVALIFILGRGEESRHEPANSNRKPVRWSCFCTPAARTEAARLR